jgi:hypothetical protein
MHVENVSIPQPYPSWTYQEVKLADGTALGGTWVSPKPLPVAHGKVFVWDESQLDWVENNV